MFGWGKRSIPAEEPQAGDGSEESVRGEPLIAAVLMEGGSFALEEFRKRIEAGSIGGASASSFQSESGNLIFQLGDELAAVAKMPRYPWSELKGPCATSWMWPTKTPATLLEKHRSHVLVTLIGGAGAPIVRRMKLLELTSRVAQQPGVMGVYWPDATMVHYPPVFIKMTQLAVKKNTPPLYLLVDFRVLRNGDGTTSLFTTGLRPLGAMELEIPKIAMEPGELREWALNIGYYMLENGHKIKDGDTIGMSAEQQIRIRHRPSSFGGSGTVMQLQT